MGLVELGEDEFVQSLKDVAEHEKQVAAAFKELEERIAALESEIRRAAENLRIALLPGDGSGWPLVRDVARQLQKVVAP